MTDTEQYVTHSRTISVRIQISGDIDLRTIEDRIRSLLEPIHSELGDSSFLDLWMEEHPAGRCQQCYAKEHEILTEDQSEK